MEKIINDILEYVKNECMLYKESSIDNYDFWNNHIKYVYEESIKLAGKYNADIFIVKIGALLHDIALIKNIGDRKEHHINGVKIAKEILDKYDIDKDIKNRILGCIENHRSSKNAKNIEELCVSDADILAHFENIPMLFNSAFNRCNVDLNNINDWLKECFYKDYDDLSDRTKELFKDRYETILDIVIGK